MDKNIIKNRLIKRFISEEATPGISVTDKAKKESGKINKAGVEAVAKDSLDYNKSLKQDSDTSKMAQNKYNYTDDAEKTYHEEMEILNGQEMIEYSSEPGAEFQQRAKEGIEGSSRMGNEGKVGNAEETWGASKDSFGKDLVKRVKDSSKKRAEAEIQTYGMGDVQIPTGNKVQVATTAMGAGKPKGDTTKATQSASEKTKIKVVKEEINQSVTTGSGWDQKTKNVQQGNLTLNSYAKQLYSLFKKEGAKVKLLSTQGGIGEASNFNVFIISLNDTLTIRIGNVGDPMGMANKYGPMIMKQFPDLMVKENPKLEGWSGMETATFILGPKQTGKGSTNVTETKVVKEDNNNNNPKIKETMKRLKFKTPFNGFGNALKVIPEGYRVDKKEFEMTDGNETYRIRWEGTLTEGKAIILTAKDSELVNENVARMRALFNYKSEDTLGTVKGKKRIDENAAFADIWKKSKALLGESEDIEDETAKDGSAESLDDAVGHAKEAKKHVEGSVSTEKGTVAPKPKNGEWEKNVKGQAKEAKKHVEGTTSDDKGTQAPKPKEGEWEKISVPQAAEAKKHIESGTATHKATDKATVVKETAQKKKFNLKENEEVEDDSEEEELTVTPGGETVDDDDSDVETSADNFYKADDDDSFDDEKEPEVDDVKADVSPEISADDTDDTDDDAIAVPTSKGGGKIKLIQGKESGEFWILKPDGDVKVPNEFLSIVQDETKKGTTKNGDSIRAVEILKSMENNDPLSGGEEEEEL